MLLLLGVFGWYAFHRTGSGSAGTYPALTADPAQPLVEITNSTVNPRRIELPDKSTITLYGQSRIRYVQRFAGSKREVYLVGKAQFSVTRNPAKPFYVYANRLTTRVLATRFTVQAYEGTGPVNVVVQSGKVSVFATKRAAPSSVAVPQRRIRIFAQLVTNGLSGAYPNQLSGQPHRRQNPNPFRDPGFGRDLQPGQFSRSAHPAGRLQYVVECRLVG